MPTDAAAATEPALDIASVRILRLAFGTAACLWFSQAVAWNLSFIAPVMTMLVLAMPMPAPRLRMGVALVAALVLAFAAGLFVLPRLLYQPMVGFLLLGLMLYWSFYIPAKGGPAAAGTLLTMGLAFSTAIGTVSVDAILLVVKGVVYAAMAGIALVWIAHAVLPESLAGASRGCTLERPALARNRASGRSVVPPVGGQLRLCAGDDQGRHHGPAGVRRGYARRRPIPCPVDDHRRRRRDHRLAGAARGPHPGRVHPGSGGGRADRRAPHLPRRRHGARRPNLVLRAADHAGHTGAGGHGQCFRRYGRRQVRRPADHVPAGHPVRGRRGLCRGCLPATDDAETTGRCPVDSGGVVA